MATRSAYLARLRTAPNTTQSVSFETTSNPWEKAQEIAAERGAQLLGVETGWGGTPKPQLTMIQIDAAYYRATDAWLTHPGLKAIHALVNGYQTP